MSGAALNSAMVLAAGLGTRMRPITDHTPKPLVEVGGMTMLDRVLAHVTAAGVSRVVINLHHLAERVEQHMQAHPLPPAVELRYSDERAALLETGGGVRHALPLLGDAPFWVANADILWLDGPGETALARLAAAWDPERMDALLLLHPLETAHGYEGTGDFHWQPDGRIAGRRDAQGRAPYVYAGVQILKPELFADTPTGAWSLNVIFDRLLAAGRLYGVVHDGHWFHVGTPDRIAPTTDQIARLGR